MSGGAPIPPSTRPSDGTSRMHGALLTRSGVIYHVVKFHGFHAGPAVFYEYHGITLNVGAE